MYSYEVAIANDIINGLIFEKDLYEKHIRKQLQEEGEIDYTALEGKILNDPVMWAYCTRADEDHTSEKLADALIFTDSLAEMIRLRKMTAADLQNLQTLDRSLRRAMHPYVTHIVIQDLQNQLRDTLAFDAETLNDFLWPQGKPTFNQGYKLLTEADMLNAVEEEARQHMSKVIADNLDEWRSLSAEGLEERVRDEIFSNWKDVSAPMTINYLGGMMEELISATEDLNLDTENLADIFSNPEHAVQILRYQALDEVIPDVVEEMIEDWWFGQPATPDR